MAETAPSPDSCTVHTHDSLQTVARDQWNALAGDDPFLRHEFLIALERNGCVGERFGWYPCHLTVTDAQGRLVGALPLYLKTNSYGEFVFDWSWASAYEQAGLSYYPKLVASVPYTPITGRRLLAHPDTDAGQIRKLLIEQALELSQSRRCSSLHWLHTAEDDTTRLQDEGLILRLGCQYHWHNQGYRDFGDFLAGFMSRKRKKVLRERRRVREQGVDLRIVHGSEADDELWRTVYRYYRETYDRKWGIPTLSLEFFKEIGRTMGDRIVIVVAEYEGRPVACAVNLRSRNALYGRYWGCEQEFHSLHFEACYYRGIEYCIENGLQRFEPGAQGEHKIARGFLPTRTWSAHWIADARFRSAIADFCRRERAAMEVEYRTLMQWSPFRQDGGTVRYDAGA